MESENVGRKINFGTLIQIGALVVAVVLAWGAFDRRTALLEMQVTDQKQTIERIEQQTNRMEHYMQSNDAHYWRKVKDSQ